MGSESNTLRELLRILAGKWRQGESAQLPGSERKDAGRSGEDVSNAKEDYLSVVEEIFGAIVDGISIQDTGFRVMYQNPAQKRLTGDRLGELCYMAYANQECVCDGCPLERTFRDGNDHVLEKNGRNRRGNYSIEIKTSALKNPDGQIIAGIEVVRDISDRGRAEKKLCQAEARYRSIFEQSPGAILIVDPETALPVEFNRKALDLLGYSPEELSALTVLRIDARETPEELRTHMKNILRKGRDDFETRIRTKEGEIRDASVSIRVIELGERRFFQFILHDITNRKTREEERIRTQKLESVGVLAGGLAHDFNNQLTAILGNVSMARMEADPQTRLATRLQEAEEALFRARGVTQRLLTFSRGGMPVRKTLFLNELIRDSAMFALQGSENRIDFSLPVDLWPVLGDEGQIRQVMYNLLANAEQAMPGTGVIRVSCENIPADRMGELPVKRGNHVRISVSDTGTGIAKKDLARIFDPYFTTKEGKSGLGLTASHSIVRKHDGGIVVESKPGAGTTVHLYLPAFEREAEEAKDEWVDPGRKRRILVMDDEECVRETTREMLLLIGYDADCAREGEEAIRMYQEAMRKSEPFAAVIMDLTVSSGMGGREAIVRLLEIDPAAKVIVSSGYNDDPMMANHERYGFRGIAPKPYTIKELHRTLSGIV